MPLTWMTTPLKMSDFAKVKVEEVGAECSLFAPSSVAARRLFSARCSSNCTRSLELLTAMYVPKSKGGAR